jgi:ornithine decarboxylase
MTPNSYTRAMELVGQVITLAGHKSGGCVRVDYIDVGGGFPIAYPHLSPPPITTYMQEITTSFKNLNLAYTPQLWAEPGRALVATGASIVVQVLLRKGNTLYVNDGVYGGLVDAGKLFGFCFPTRLIRANNNNCNNTNNLGNNDNNTDNNNNNNENNTDNNNNNHNNLTEFEMYGPSCCSSDHMKGPFFLPNDVSEGDYVEVGNLGTYSASLRTPFNGFDRFHHVIVRDPPLVVVGRCEKK